MPTDHPADASSVQPATAPAQKNWRQRLGIGLIVYSILPLLTVELVAFLPLSTAQALAFGAVYVASGEVAFFAAVALLGKPFVQAFKDKIKSLLFKSKPAGAHRVISKTRHYFGVTLFWLSILPYYLAIGSLMFSKLGEPDDLRFLLYMLLSGEALFIVSLFVLGDEFWNRLKRLFEWPGNAQEQAPCNSRS